MHGKMSLAIYTVSGKDSLHESPWEENIYGETWKAKYMYYNK